MALSVVRARRGGRARACVVDVVVVVVVVVVVIVVDVVIGVVVVVVVVGGVAGPPRAGCPPGIRMAWNCSGCRVSRHVVLWHRTCCHLSPKSDLVSGRVW